MIVQNTGAFILILTSAIFNCSFRHMIKYHYVKESGKTIVSIYLGV